MTRNGVLGGGALGLTAALRLAQRGESVVLFERESTPGGLASGFKLGTSYLEKFYHHLFRSDTAALALIEELGLRDRLVWPRPRTSTLIGGKRYQLDSALTVLRFGAVPLVDRLRLGAAVGYLRLERNYHRMEHTTADRWMRRYMGDRVYRTLWEPVLRGKFGDRYDEITMSWMWARIHQRSPNLGYLRGGFQQLYDRLAEYIRQLGGETRFGSEIIGVRRDGAGTFCIEATDGEHEVDRIVSTLPTALTIKLTPQLGDNYSARYGRLDSYGAHCMILALDRPLTDVYWLNICDPGFPFVGLFEHTNYMPVEDYGGRHIVYLGNYLPMDDPLFGMNEQQVLERFLPALRRVNPDFLESWVTDHWMFKAPFAQPIVTLGYADRLPPHETPLKHFLVANMSQVYPQDRGQSYSIALAERLISGLPGAPPR
ncbi:MAG: NAD(P)/FAD-dependent oxidoreductase [Chloroflexota bacterium]